MIASLLLSTALTAPDAVKKPAGPLANSAATAPRPALEPACHPGTGASIGADEIKLAVVDGRAIVAPREGTVLASLDRALLCPGMPDEVPCVVAGPLQLSCARLAGAIDLSHIVVIGDLLIDRGSVDAGIRLEDVQIVGSLRLSGATLGNGFIAEHLLVTGELLVDGLAGREGFSASDLRVLGRADFSGAKLEGAIALKQMLVGKELNLSPAKAASLSVSNSTVLGETSLQDAEIVGELNFDRVGLRGSLDSLELTVGGETSFSNLIVRDDVSLSGHFKKNVTMTSCQAGLDIGFTDGDLGGALTLKGCRSSGQAFLGEMQVHGNLRIDDCSLDEGVDLGPATIGGEVALINSRFGSPVQIDQAKLTGQPRVVGCTPANPIAGTDLQDQP